jgi:tetratricopeptide (TPR) repeat protein
VTERLLFPLLILVLFAIVLPAPPPDASRGMTDQECVTLADTPIHPEPDVMPRLERCARLYPDDAELAGDLAFAYEAAGDPVRAEAAYKRALSIDPGYADLRLRLGYLLLRRGAALEAAREAEAALHIQPNRRVLVQLLRQAKEASGEAPE